MGFTLTAEEKAALLADARETIAARLENRSPLYKRSSGLAAAVESGSSALTKPCGAFVSLHKTTGDAGGTLPAGSAGSRRLRGCIGRMTGAESLEKTVRTMAIEAAFDDPRFPSLGAAELPHCDIEISVLSPMEKCPDPRQLKVGVHGLYLIHRGRSGVLLPQVPVEQGWNLDEYLDYICVKAGLPPGSYEAPDAELLTFTAVVFGETAPAPC
ncbi:MAG: AmmeMemoRadiSam system protein A [Spirochaetaceae bacterium]|jgi:AmmeMemoRadiSam system protein A|nr:AmmeMemoRadiSam system protein A [Spirochaetaceae bacterium]